VIAIVRTHHSDDIVCSFRIRVELEDDIAQWVGWKRIRNRCNERCARGLEVISGKKVLQIGCVALRRYSDDARCGGLRGLRTAFHAAVSGWNI
jgi:hypothetical protein